MTNSQQGLFITLEGIDGSGKSTHIPRLESFFRQQGHDVIVTREPGGTPLSEKLRALLLNDVMDDLTEVLLAFAARRDHICAVIQPALAAGKVVLCDRFTDSTFAYQGSGRELSWEVLSQLERMVLGDAHQRIRPDLTIWFQVPAEVAAKRVALTRTRDRFEMLPIDFFQRVVDGYQKRLLQEPDRFVLIDTQQEIEMVWSCIKKTIETRAWRR